jgi:acetoacetyl-CoA reductase
MTPLLTNICSIQSEMINQWFNSSNSAKQVANNLLKTSHDMLKIATRQQHTSIENILGSIDNIHKEWGNSSTNKNSQLGTGIAVITGGIGGIGTAISKRLSTDGNQIIATYIAAEKDKAIQWKRKLEKESYRVDIYECDVSNFESCKKLANQIEEDYGHIDVLVNAAGITRDAMLKNMDPTKWDAVIKTNLDSVFNVTRNFIQGMLKNQYGRIINISSVNGQKGQFGQTNYSTAKAGMIGFTRSLALELADKGITVNCVCPGYVGTPMVEGIRKDVLDGIIDQIPMGRLARTEEIADAVAFLADRKSAYITGTELAVNGGLWMG